MKRLLPALFALLAGAAAAQNTNTGPSGPQIGPRPESEWELEQQRRNPEDAAGVQFPAWPKQGDLIEFPVSSASSFHFFIDAASLSLSADRVVRYTLVARSAAGAENVSYEGMRCAENLYRIYAYGQDQRWVAQPAEWRTIEPNATRRWHLELRTRFFCPSRGTILSVAEGLDALRRGVHPSLKFGLGN